MLSSMHLSSVPHHQYHHVHSRAAGQELGKVASGRSHRRCCSYHGISTPHGISSGQHPDAALLFPCQKMTRRGCLVATHSQAGNTAPTQPDQPRSAADQPFLRVVLPTALALLLCNMDRICLSVAIIPMSAEFGWAGGLQVSRHSCRMVHSRWMTYVGGYYSRFLSVASADFAQLRLMQICLSS
eukprot:1143281-Pelagomonas_calceolata.AAC.7